MIKYVFSDSPLTLKSADKADPQVMGEALQKIADAADGRLTPHDVVVAAENKRHVLHRFFEWDDEKAANSYRLEQAREIVRIVRVEERPNMPAVRAFVSINEGGSTAYRSLGEIQNSRNLQLLVLKAAERDLAAWEKRYSELVDICDRVREARLVLSEKIDLVKPKPNSDDDRPSAN